MHIVNRKKNEKGNPIPCGEVRSQRITNNFGRKAIGQEDGYIAQRHTFCFVLNEMVHPMRVLCLPVPYCQGWKYASGQKLISWSGV